MNNLVIKDIECFVNSFNNGKITQQEFVDLFNKKQIIYGKRHGFCDNNCSLCEELNCVCEHFINKENDKLTVVHL